MTGRLRPAPWRPALLAVAALSLGSAAALLVGTFAVNRQWVERVPVPAASQLDSDLFATLVEGGAIWPERQGVATRIGHTPCNTLSLASPDDAPLISGPAGREGRRHVRELCESPQGERIREEIANFNRGFLLAAISDNRKAGEAAASADGALCADGASRAKFFVPSGCFANEWAIFLAADGRPAQAVPVAAVSPLEYAFLATAETGYFGDWRVVAPFADAATGEPGDHLLRSSVTFGEKPVVVRTVGIPVSLSIDGVRVEAGEAGFARTGLQAGGKAFLVSATTICALDEGRPGESAVCGPDDVSGRAAGAYVRLEGPAGATASVEITVRPVALAARELRLHRAAALRAARAGARPDPQAGQRSVAIGAGRVRMSCSIAAPVGEQPVRGAAQTGCEPGWTVAEAGAVSGGSEAPVSLRAGDVVLLDGSGALSEEAFTLGFATLVGLGVEDAGSVGQAMARSGKSRNLDLTIDPTIQALALEALSRHYRCPGDLPCERRADLVVLDAEGETAGEVLAMAGLPRPMPGLSAWDIETLERSAPARSPMAGYGWRNHDLRSTPGSTFKLVTALAASQHVLDTGDEELAEYLTGASDVRGLARRLGLVACKERSFSGRCTPLADQERTLEFNALPVPDASGGRTVFHIGNAAAGEGNGSRATLASIFEPGDVSRCAPGSAAVRAGICEALKDSSNLFFGGLALAIDAGKLRKPGSDAEHGDAAPDLALARMAARLFAPAPSSQEGEGDGSLDLFGTDYGGSGRARASPLVVEAALAAPPGEPRRLRLARGGIGLSVAASPAAMAAVAASIATGRLVRPRLASPGGREGEEAEPVLEAPSGREDLRDRLLAEIRNGMAAVVTAGTARAALSGLPAELRRSIRAKTGTAPLVQAGEAAPPDGRYAAWIVGYVEPPAGRSGIKRRIAFACRIANSQTGGAQACGPVVADFLASWHRR